MGTPWARGSVSLAVAVAAAVALGGCSSKDSASSHPGGGGVDAGPLQFASGGAGGAGGSGASGASGAVGAGGAVEIGTFTELTGTHHLLSAESGVRCVADPAGIVTCASPSGSTDFWDPLPTDPLATFDLGHHDACGLTANGELRCWADAFGDGSILPSGPFTAVAAGMDARCGVRPSGNIECWGSGSATTPPAGKFVDVVMDGDFGCALAADGHVTCWGDSLGRYDNVTDTFKQIVTGSSNLCGVLLDGTAKCVDGAYMAGTPAPAGAFVQVSVGTDNACGLRADGSVVCWGTGEIVRLPPPPGPFTEIASNYDYACGRAADGSVTCWGSDWGDGAATLGCTRSSVKLAGTVGSTALSAAEHSSWESASADVPGYRFAYHLYDDTNTGIGLAVFDGSTEIGPGVSVNVLKDSQSVPVDRAVLAVGGTLTAPGPIYCGGGGGSSVKMHIDELSVDLRSVGLLGTCPGTPVSGAITVCTSGCSGVTGTLDGSTLTSHPDQYESGAGPGLTTMYLDDTSLLEFVGTDSGGIAWGVLVTAAAGALGGAVYCIGGGSWTATGSFGDATFQLTGFSKLGACPAGSTGTVTGCVR